jgi:hypothetical protein
MARIEAARRRNDPSHRSARVELLERDDWRGQPFHPRSLPRRRAASPEPARGATSPAVAAGSWVSTNGMPNRRSDRQASSGMARPNIESVPRRRGPGYDHVPPREPPVVVDDRLDLTGEPDIETQTKSTSTNGRTSTTPEARARHTQRPSHGSRRGWACVRVEMASRRSRPTQPHRDESGRPPPSVSSTTNQSRSAR